MSHDGLEVFTASEELFAWSSAFEAVLYFYAMFLEARTRQQKRYIAGLGWFNLLDDPVTRPNNLTTGLMTYEGERKPAFNLLRERFRATPLYP